MAHDIRDTYAHSHTITGDMAVSNMRSIHPFTPYSEVFEGSELTSQDEALYWLLMGRNVILSGQAGTGKSWVISQFTKIIARINSYLLQYGVKNEEGVPPQFRVETTASTGVASTLIFGQTIHKWSGLGIINTPLTISSDGKPIFPLQSQRDNFSRVRSKINRTDCLIIDEISMLPSHFLHNLDVVCRCAKENYTVPFGGIQIVLVGDFMQLPPVDTGAPDDNGNPVDNSYCFFATDIQGKSLIKNGNFVVAYLDKVRRSKDSRLTDILNGIRNNTVTDDMVGMLYERVDIDESQFPMYTHLYTTNMNVDEYNQQEYKKLTGEEYTFEVIKEINIDNEADKLISNGRLETVHIKVGAHVMVTANNACTDSKKAHLIANGTMGIVESIEEGRKSEVVIIKTKYGSVPIGRVSVSTKKLMPRTNNNGSKSSSSEETIVGEVEYMPLKLAWAITVHKSQGQTVDGAIIDLSRCFTAGLGYVALSRVQSLDSIILTGENPLPDKVFEIDPSAREIDSQLIRAGKKTREILTRYNDMTRETVQSLRKRHGGTMTDDDRQAILANPRVGYEFLTCNDSNLIEWFTLHRARYHDVSRRRRGSNSTSQYRNSSQSSYYYRGRKYTRK